MAHTNINEYALNILKEHGCDCYTYGGEFAKHCLADLKEAYPNGMEYPYVDVANAILAMSRPMPIVRKSYKVVWDNESCCDGHGCDTFEIAKSDVEEILVNWIVEEVATWKNNKPSAENIENFNYMIYNCNAWVEKYNPDTDEYEEYWFPNDEFLKSIGWEEIKEEE